MIECGRKLDHRTSNRRPITLQFSPSQSSTVQALFCSSGPLHWRPLLEGTGLSHFRFLVCSPSPQLTEQLDQLPHLEYCPCIAEREEGWSSLNQPVNYLHVSMGGRWLFLLGLENNSFVKWASQKWGQLTKIWFGHGFIGFDKTNLNWCKWRCSIWWYDLRLIVM